MLVGAEDCRQQVTALVCFRNGRQGETLHSMLALSGLTVNDTTASANPPRSRGRHALSSCYGVYINIFLYIMVAELCMYGYV